MPDQINTEKPAEASFDLALDYCVFHWQKTIDAYFEEKFPSLEKSILSIHRMKKFVKIISTDGNGRQKQAWAFIDLKTGDVYRPDTWSRSAKIARANIFNHPFENISHHGPKEIKDCVNLEQYRPKEHSDNYAERLKDCKILHIDEL